MEYLDNHSSIRTNTTLPHDKWIRLTISPGHFIFNQCPDNISLDSLYTPHNTY